MVRSKMFSALVLSAVCVLTSCGTPAAPSSNTNTPAGSGSIINQTPGKVAQEDIICTEEYAPVCGKLQIQCITTPCDPVEQTFPNRCYAQRDKAVDITEGACAME